MKQLRKLLWLTQLGISLVTPPLLCIFFGPPGPKQMGLGRLDHGRRHCKRPGGLRVQRGDLPALLQKDG